MTVAALPLEAVPGRKIDGHVPGSVIDWCARCRRRVVVAPSSQLLMSQHPNPEVVCLACIPTLIQGQEGPTTIGTVPGSIEEFQAWLKRRAGRT